MSRNDLYLELTVADHEANGFVGLARWRIADMAQGEQLLAELDRLTPSEAAGDPKTDPYTFIMDLRGADDDLLQTSQLCLPLQIAMRLAPERVTWWMNTRPDPDSLAHLWPPTQNGLPSLAI